MKETSFCGLDHEKRTGMKYFLQNCSQLEKKKTHLEAIQLNSGLEISYGKIAGKLKNSTSIVNVVTFPIYFNDLCEVWKLG